MSSLVSRREMNYLKEIKMNVNGIMCINCVNKINGALTGLNGCESSAVSEDFSTVSVKYDEEQISAGHIIGTIESIKGKSFHVANKEELIK